MIFEIFGDILEDFWRIHRDKNDDPRLSTSPPSYLAILSAATDAIHSDNLKYLPTPFDLGLEIVICVSVFFLPWNTFWTK